MPNVPNVYLLDKKKCTEPMGHSACSRMFRCQALLFTHCLPLSVVLGVDVLQEACPQCSKYIIIMP